MLTKLSGLCALLLLLSACGGGGGGSSSTAGSPLPSTPTSTPAPTPAAPTLGNVVSLVVDGGPTSLTTGPNAVIESNIAYVTVTLCAPGSTTNCQTIDHVQVDTGSVGLRIARSALNASLLAAMPTETDAAANPVGECYEYVDGYTFGSVRQADFTIGGEVVADMPLQVVGDSGAFATPPSSCSSGGGQNLDTISALGANGIIGLGTTTTDCGVVCTGAGGASAAAYYDCPSSGCSTLVARSASTTAPFQQLPNPVAAMSVDNNGIIVSFPVVPAGGAAGVTGTLYFGIGTQTNNGLGSATVLAATSSTSPMGPGFVTATYNGQSLPDSFIDSGSSIYFFTDAAIAGCTTKADAGYYCPPSPITVSPTLTGQDGASASAAFTLNDAAPLLATSYAVLPGIGGDPSDFDLTNASPTSFDFGLTFFYGRSVYTAIEGRSAGGVVGPYYAY